MARVCAVVQNSVSRDARVLKQAGSLADAGHEVTIVGIADNYDRRPETVLDNGVRIVRVVAPAGRNLVKRLVSAARAYGRLIGSLAILALLLVGWKQTTAWKIGLLYTGSIGLTLLFLAREMSVVLSRGDGRRLIGFLWGIAGMVAPSLIETHGARARRLAAMADAVCALDPDIVHCHDIHTLPIGAQAKKRLGCRIVYDAHEIYEELAQGNKGTAARYRWLHRKFTNVADRFITINESIAAWYAGNYPALPPAVIVMNAAPAARPFTYDGRMHGAACLPRDAKILLYQGGFASKRGLDYLVAAAEFLPPDWTLVMMGWGRTEPHLRRLADDIAARVSRNAPVCFIPPAPQSELPLWTAGATIGVIPYENSGLNHLYCTPNKLWEYPNAGVPVLVSPLPELRKPVEAFGYGWTLPETQDPESLANQVGSLTDTEIVMARKACKAFIAADNWSKYAKRLVALYDGMADAPLQKPASGTGGRVLEQV